MLVHRWSGQANIHDFWQKTHTYREGHVNSTQTLEETPTQYKVILWFFMRQILFQHCIWAILCSKICVKCINRCSKICVHALHLKIICLQGWLFGTNLLLKNLLTSKTCCCTKQSWPGFVLQLSVGRTLSQTDSLLLFGRLDNLKMVSLVWSSSLKTAVIIQQSKSDSLSVTDSTVCRDSAYWTVCNKELMLRVLRFRCTLFKWFFKNLTETVYLYFLISLVYLADDFTSVSWWREQKQTGLNLNCRPKIRLGTLNTETYEKPGD